MSELSPAAKKARSLYMKKWKAAHPEKVKEYEARTWEKKGRKLMESEKLSTNENK